MKFYGDANLQQNELQNAVLTTLTAFPPSPKAGQVAFVNSTVYICVTAGALPIWVPLTREITAYAYYQNTPASTWTVTHNLNTTSVNVQIYDSNSNVIIPSEITTNSASVVTVSFGGTPVAGRAILVSGHFDGNIKPTYAYTYYQSTSSTTWTVLHNLGYYPVVRVFIGNQEVQPLTITHDSAMQVTITFSTPQVGYARLI